jgi:ATP-dependent DNA helicase RecQ
MKVLQEAGIITRGRLMGYHLGNKKVPSEKLIQLADASSEKDQHNRQSLEHMVSYAQSGYCRWKVLLEYFSEEAEWEHCDHCDNCLQPPEAALTPAHVAIGQGSKGQKNGSSGTNLPGRTVTLSPAFAVGTAVQVPQMGKGQVIGSTKEMITILFPDNKKRNFLKNYVKPIRSATRRRRAT